jgi:hypothetical protein
MFRRLWCALLLSATATIVTGCWPTPRNNPVIIRSDPKPAETISVQCEGAELRLIADRIAQHLNLVIDYPNDLHGYSSVKLRDVTWRQAFKVIFSPVRYDFYERDGIIIIRSAEEIRALPPVTGNISLKHHSPAAVVAYLNRLHPEFGAAVSATETGVAYLIHPKRLHCLREEIVRIDSPEVSLQKKARPARLPETLPASLPPRPSHLSPADVLTTEVFVAEHIDVFLIRPILENELVGQSSAKVRPDVRINALIVTAPEPLMPRLQAVVEYLDDPRWIIPSDSVP